MATYKKTGTKIKSAQNNIEEKSSSYSRMELRTSVNMLIDIKFVVLHNGNNGKYFNRYKKI